MTDPNKTGASMLARIAVIGLNNQTDFLSVLDVDVREALGDGERGNDAQRFLDAAALSVLSESIGRVPAPDRFDELPPLPEEQRRLIPSALIPWLRTRLDSEAPAVRQVLLFLIHRHGFAIPDELTLPLLDAVGADHQLRSVVAGSLGARGRWLARLNDAWQALREPDDLSFVAMDSARQWEALAEIERQPDDEVVSWVTGQWPRVDAGRRLRLVRLLRARKHPRAFEMLTEALADRSQHVRREAHRALARHGIGELRERAVALCRHFLRPDARKVEITVPEEDTGELKAIGVADDDYGRTGLAKAVLRLGQLLVLAGPAGIAEVIGAPVDEAMRRLARSRFKAELEFFLLEGALAHADRAALEAWAKAYRKLETLDGDRLASIAERCDFSDIAPSLVVLAANGHAKLVSDPKVWEMLHRCRVDCDATATAALIPGILKSLGQRNLYTDQQHALRAAAMLDPETALAALKQALAALGEAERGVGSLDVLEQVLAFKQHLIDAPRNALHARSHESSTRSPER